MAAVTRSPPPTASPTNARKPQPLPLHNISTQSFDWDDGQGVKPLSAGDPSSESPRLRQPPRSPVRLSIRPDNWPQPSNASIENSHDEELPPLPAKARFHSDLPRTPDAPTPPPRTPGSDKYQQRIRTLIMAEKSVRPVPAQSSAEPAPSRLTKASRTGTASSNPEELANPSSGDSIKNGRAAVRSPASKKQPAGGRPVDLPDTDDTSNSDVAHPHDGNRDSRETESTVSTTQTQPQASTGYSSGITSASSISGDVKETPDSHDASADDSPESSVVDAPSRPESVPQLQYHHQQFLPRASTVTPAAPADPRIASTPDLLESSGAINRHLTPNQFMRRSSLPRPQSAYSAYSDMGPRGRSPNTYGGGSHMRAPSAQSRNSPDVRPVSYADMLNVPYPQPGPAPITFDNSQLRNAVGTNASLLSTQKTLEMYRQNVKKTNDLSIQYSFAVFLISTAQEMGFDPAEEPASPAARRKGSPKSGRNGDGSASPYLESASSSPHELVREAKNILQKLASAGYPFAQYYLADGYASGLFSKGKEDYNAAFPLFVLAAKHGHAESAYRTGLCYEFGWGCRKDPAKAVQFLRIAASKRHPGAMNRLGKACLSGDLGERRYREGIKWLKLATEAADTIYNAAPYHLGCLYETGYGDDIFLDEGYAAELFTQAADLGHAEASYRMGDAYEHGRLNCPRDPALSVHFYTGAAERGHAGAMMGLCAWYMVGAEPILEKDEEEAYEWARRAAELGNVKAQYAVGYFTEMGIGCRRDILEANVWYVQAADAGDERAKQRLAAIRAAVSGGTPMEVAPPRNGGKIKKNSDKDENCVVM